MVDRKIRSARISQLPKNLRDPLPIVFVTFDDEEEKQLFDFYPDEISFKPEEFIGLTENQARDLKRRKDKRYLETD